jgi:erythromycin esterase-like protein
MTMFRRSGRTLVARFTSVDAQVLRQCVAELAALLSDTLDRDDPAVERLFPDVYPEDPDDEAEYRRFTEADLKATKLDQVRTVLSDLLQSGGEVRLDEQGADVWLRALTDVRLALGTRLGVQDDTDIQSELDDAVLRDPTSTRVGQLSVYAYLSLLQESLVGALTE